MEYPLCIRGEAREFEARIVPVGADEVIVIVRDITESKRALDQLRLTEYRLNEAQRIAKIGSWERDLTTNEVWWSAEIYRMLEIDRDDAPATFATFLSRVHVDDRPNVMTRVADAERTGEPYVSYFRLSLPSGALRTVYDRAFVVFDAGGVPTRMIGTVQDISEQVELEQELVTVRERAPLGARRLPADGVDPGLRRLSLGLEKLTESLTAARAEQAGRLAQLEKSLLTLQDELRRALSAMSSSSGADPQRQRRPDDGLRRSPP
jgi:hypothetical protein